MSLYLSQLEGKERKEECLVNDVSDRVTDAVALLPKTTQEQIAALKRGWMFVGKTHQDASHHCEECGFNRVEVQFHPYQEGWAPETYSECVLSSRLGAKPEECPAYEEHLRIEKEEQEGMDE